MKKNFLLIALLLVYSFCFGQEEETPLDSIAEKMIIMEGDSIMQSTIALEEYYVFSKLKFSSYEEKLRYYILRRKTLKVYPYAKLAADRLTELNDSLTKITKNSHKRKYTREIQKYIEGEFSDELKKLTRTEGQILVKLIHRQTGNTAFDLVKELRNGWRAFWYNATAKMFKISLKEEFNPELVHEDYLIEDILQRAFSQFRIERQKSALNFDYSQLTDKWSVQKK
ncbi:DUF4294 domain-containing protein [Cellulophaga sp. E16_2]|uniref:DUF4294 domain-containing protein n=1 Tax=Cellulophaga algicola (strain DSM 14237 / IC166 / ACAM 630) TaxID=688270 RepID=E6X682_CELAD|nr:MULTISPECIES: DUF4294 domain-containing protein [Cellulophaga]ADV47382.1 hypothetical protein Celal_0024 [Cellulophaga algicola DSM 14237]MBO0589778.1 DUF4294 domain-containing protein [Cellulophaga sp. E16_2]